ncbi:MAG TPA: hypothetical protein VHF01_13795, partial [Candidatus Acidoferrum sp.]|nr:hypothetical protein [Candidatus Acidoferrum sp.]
MIAEEIYVGSEAARKRNRNIFVHSEESSGTGPYNAWLDPIVVSEWQKMAYYEVEKLAEQGVPGVWTHGFYDGWA